MIRSCEQCGKEYRAVRSQAKYCSAVCRSAASKARKRVEADDDFAADATVVALAGRKRRQAMEAPAGESSVESALRAELGDAIGTLLGQQALVLAKRMDDRVDTSGSAVATLSKQLVVLTAAALRDRAPSAEEDPVAAIQAQVIAIRDRARASAG